MEAKPAENPYFRIIGARTIDDLRRRMGFILQGGKGKEKLGILPAESVSPELYRYLRELPGLEMHIALNQGRAESLGWASNAKAIEISATPFTYEEMQALADASRSQCNRHSLERIDADQSVVGALDLIKRAGLLPATLVLRGAALEQDIEPFCHWQRLSLGALQAFLAEPQAEITLLSRAKLPLDGAEQTEIFGFRGVHGQAHLALVIGQPKEPALVRVHSSCVTGDLLGSLRCDCGDQLKLALARIKEEGSGILLYLHQEGRDIGIINKLRAYTLQEQGMDTYDANRVLGFAEDERDFVLAASMLKTLGHHTIRLLTNNPDKIDALTNHGIRIGERVPLVATSQPHNQPYLDSKRHKAGHWV